MTPTALLALAVEFLAGGQYALGAAVLAAAAAVAVITVWLIGGVRRNRRDQQAQGRSADS